MTAKTYGCRPSDLLGADLTPLEALVLDVEAMKRGAEYMESQAGPKPGGNPDGIHRTYY